MKKIVGVFVLSLLCACALPAQTFNMDSGREPIASLDGLWRFHTGDNPEWPSPNFDDSQWRLLRSDTDWAKQGYPGYSGYAWYRFQVVVLPDDGDLSIFLPPILTSYQVFVEGKLAKTVGRMPPGGTGTMTFPAIIPLPIGASQGPRSITIALRVWHWPGWSNYHGGGPQTGGGLVGQTFLLQPHAKLVHESRLLESGGYTLALVEGIAGLLGLLLFLIRRTEWEYLWFAGNALLNAIIFTCQIYWYQVPVAIITRDWVDNFLGLASALFFIAFLVTLLRARRTVLLYLAIAASFLQILNYIFLQIGLYDNVGWSVLMIAFLETILLVWAADLLIRKSRAGLPDARLLLVPVLLSLTLTPIETAFWGAYQLGWQKAVTSPDINLFTQPFDFNTDDAIEIFFLLAMLAILINRFARTRREEQRIVGELEAARGMQSLLVPATPPVTPGFEVESVYLPASEVGGDFFQILPGEDGSLLIVMGDVIGKGLKAAMTVSTIVGALRNEKARQPADVLRHLNEVLNGQISGFVTCCAALIAADGAMTVANAGHLAPYLNGKELTVEGGLPLGIVEDGRYQETSYQLAPGDRLTFISDGVVEATNEKKELFGFERVQAISDQAAHTIAEAAKTFGQDDDISVLSVTRTASLTAVPA